MMIIIWLVFGIIVYNIISKAGEKTLPLMPEETSLEVLEYRYVNGEIDEETYMQMHEVLTN